MLYDTIQGFRIRLSQVTQALNLYTAVIKGALMCAYYLRHAILR